MRNPSLRQRSSETLAEASPIPQLAAIAVAVLAAAVLIGWQFDIESLKRVMPRLVAMNPATAVALALSAAALWLGAWGQPAGWARATATGLALVVVAVGLACLRAYMGGWDPWVDQILFASELRSGGPRSVEGETVVNRMAPNTAFLFVLLGCSLAMLARGAAAWIAVAKALAILTALVACISLIGYLNNVTSLYRPTQFIPIALHTAWAFLVLAMGVLTAKVVKASEAAGGGANAGDEAEQEPEQRFVHVTERRVAFGFGAALFLISVIGIVAYASIRDFAADSRAQAHAREVTGAVAQLSATIERLDAGARGYLLVGDEAYLEPYRAGVASVDDYLDRVASLTQDVGQQRRLAEVRDLIEAKLAYLATVVERREADDREAVEQLTATGEGRAIMNEIRQVLAQMQEGQAAMGGGAAGFQASVGVTIAVIAAGTGLALVLVAVSGVMVRQGMRQRRRVEAQLRRARDAANAANRTKSQFLANMSHEIRTPMTAIIGYADLLLDAAQAPSDRLNYVNTIRRNGEHLLTIINDVLDLSKIEAGKLAVERGACAPCQVLSETASLMRVRASEKDLPFECRVEGEIPETIQSDPTRLRQILINLVGNAVKFTDAGWVRLIVRMDEAEEGRPLLRFDVIDTGVGMTREAVGRLFQPFGQADASTTRQYGGTGLGLTICKRLAEMLGGWIEVDSSPGRGSTFSLLIDPGSLDEARMLDSCCEAMESPEGGSSEAMASTAKPLSGRILLVDDGLDNRQLLSVYLRQAGATVTVAEDGRQGCEKALAAMDDGKPFDLILMDMQMPVLDGYGAAARLRSKGLMTPIVALTAHAMREDRDKCLNAGCTDYLSKPIRRHELIRALAQHLPQGAGAESLQTLGMASLQSDRAAGLLADQSQTVDGPFDKAVVEEPLEARDESVQELLADFLRRLPQDLHELQRCLEQEQLDELANLTHNLKGTGGLYGFMSITNAAARAEDQINSGASLETIRGEVERLIATVHQVDRTARGTNGASPDPAAADDASPEPPRPGEAP